ncbi:MAG: chromosome segregation protein SMC [Verrucomicrobiota bacterium]
MKKLDIVGFKSFADPTSIDFHKGVTAIVGPNGCGKSNVLDSIRWVLGEQSARALRGGAMADVIFNGTDTRKSTSMAEVSMTFTECEGVLDTDFKEVCITRRVFRDGRSEYEINKTSCRLKDVQRLFMDTGIGRSSYSIMEQGKIDLLLSSKPEERRQIFEEAAGITKFKTQKKEALRKLELTESNLVRVTDIIKEVRRQIGSLQRQAAKAKKYKEVFARLRLLDTHFARYQFGLIKKELTEKEKQIEVLQTKVHELKAGMETKEAGLLQKRMDLENLNEALRNLEQEKSRAVNAVEKSQQEITFNKQRIKEIEDLKERNRQDIAAGEEKVKVQEEQARLVADDQAKAGVELKSAQEALNEHQQQLQKVRDSVNDLQRKRSDLEHELTRSDERLHQGREKLNVLELQQRSYVLRVEKLEEEEGILKKRMEELQSKGEGLNTLKEKKELSVAKTSEEAEGLVKVLEEKQGIAKDCQHKTNETQQALSQTQARMYAVEKLIASRTGYSETTKKLLEVFHGQEISGTLLDFIKVEPGYEKAVQACLGLAWELLIVKDETALRNVLGKLNEVGQAVLAVSAVVTETSSEATPKNAAIHFVKPQDQIRPLVEKLLNGFYIVENSAEAEELTSRGDHVNIVTKEGEFWSDRGWQIRGPFIENKHSILEQDNELLALQDECKRREFESKEAYQGLEKANAQVLAIETQLAELKTKRREAEGELSALVYEMQGVARQTSEWEDKLRDNKEQRVKLSEQDTLDRDQHKELEQEIVNLINKRKDLQAELERLAEDLKTQAVDVEEWMQKVTDSRIALASQQQRTETFQQQAQSIQARLEELYEALRTRKAEMEEYQSRYTQSSEIITSAEETIQGATKKIETLKKDIEDQVAKVKSLQQDYNQSEQSVKADRETLSGIQSACGKEEVSIAEKRMEINALVERIQRSYQLDLNDANASLVSLDGEDQLEQSEDSEITQNEEQTSEDNLESTEVQTTKSELQEAVGITPDDITDWDSVQEEIKSLQERVDRMGPVNVESISEYEELDERLNFLEKQERDLTASRDQLHEAIKKINMTTLELFSETFTKIQKNFSEMFHELFGGGKAELALVNEEDPLESGIEIIAKPPGKQLQNISLLSGGEKTMTAVAMLFAIYMVKPSPFCILDEMDAPLDESNIMRFIKILQRFVNQSQFVVITHNKRTISSADVLYGVTMQEHGVSKIVSVKLSRKDEDPLFPNKDDDSPTIADSVRGSELASMDTQEDEIELVQEKGE